MNEHEITLDRLNEHAHPMANGQVEQDEPGPQPWPVPLSSRELLERELPEPHAIVQGLIHEGELVQIVGPSKGGKSWLMMQLGICVASGREFIGYPVPEPRECVLFDTEMPEALIDSRLRLFRDNMADEWPEGYRVCSLRSVETKSVQALGRAIADYIEMHGTPGLVIVDSLYKISGVDECDQERVAELMNRLGEISSSMAVAIVYAGHTPKSNPYTRASDMASGSGIFGRAADTCVGLRVHPNDTHTLAVTTDIRSCVSRPDFVIRPRYVQDVDGPAATNPWRELRPDLDPHQKPEKPRRGVRADSEPGPPADAGVALAVALEALGPVVTLQQLEDATQLRRPDIRGLMDAREGWEPCGPRPGGLHFTWERLPPQTPPGE